jgi:hypothetical protein
MLMPANLSSQIMTAITSMTNAIVPKGAGKRGIKK